MLQKYVRQYARGRVLDMGTGSGIQALIAKEKTRDVLAVDINPDAVALVKKKGITALVSDLFENVTGTFDVVIFNPPYLPEDERESFEDRVVLSGGKYGSEILERFFSRAKQFLRKDGKILIVFSTITGDVEFLLKRYGYAFKKLDEKSFFFEKIFVYVVWLQR